jgi:hypothetical protein
MAQEPFHIFISHIHEEAPRAHSGVTERKDAVLLNPRRTRGKPYTRDGFQTQWQRVMTKAFPENADRFTFHDIRAKSLSDAPTLEEARKRAQHSDARITQHVYRRLPEAATTMDIGHLKGTK